MKVGSWVDQKSGTELEKEKWTDGNVSNKKKKKARKRCILSTNYTFFIKAYKNLFFPITNQIKFRTNERQKHSLIQGHFWVGLFSCTVWFYSACITTSSHLQRKQTRRLNLSAETRACCIVTSGSVMHTCAYTVVLCFNLLFSLSAAARWGCETWGDGTKTHRSLKTDPEPVTHKCNPVSTAWKSLKFHTSFNFSQKKRKSDNDKQAGKYPWLAHNYPVWHNGNFL